jgi:hypothetical protein
MLHEWSAGGPVSEGELEAVWTGLLASRCRPAAIPAIDRPGLYALFLNDPAALKDLAVSPSGLLYVGASGSSLEARNHFTHADSGFSSPRRSLGALLKGKLGLRAIARGSGASPSNARNYRFTPDGEQCLTAWMMEHLDYAFTVVEREAEAVERCLIAGVEPPLNLTGWPNPQRRQLRHLRALCHAEARQDLEARR